MSLLSNIEELYRLKENRNAPNIVINNGTYRLLHAGHAQSFEDMRELADKWVNEESKQGAVYIFVDSKKRVSEIKPGAYCQDDESRLNFIERCKGVTRAFLFNSIEEMQQDIKSMWQVNKLYYNKLIYCKSADYTNKEMNMKNFIESIGGEVVLLPYNDRYSSSKIIAELQGMK